MGVGGQRHAPADLPPGETRYPLYRRLGRPQDRSGRMRKIRPTRIRNQTVQPVASRYTDWAILAIRYTSYFKNKVELLYLYINNDSTLSCNKSADSLRSIPFGRHTSLHRQFNFPGKPI
jgi:hypothetical protein